MKSIKQAIGALGLVGLLASGRADDLRTEVLGDVGNGIASGIHRAQRTSSGNDGSGDDSFWSGVGNPPEDFWLKPQTLPYGTEPVKNDKRSLLNQVYNIEVKAQDINALGGVTSPVSVQFTFVSQDTNMTYLARINQDSAWTQSGVGITNLITNITHGLTIPMYAIQSVPHDTTFMTVDVMMKDFRPEIIGFAHNVPAGKDALTVRVPSASRTEIEYADSLSDTFQNVPIASYSFLPTFPETSADARVTGTNTSLFPVGNGQRYLRARTTPQFE